MNEELTKLIDELKKYDNKEGYKLDYEIVKKNLSPTIMKIINLGESCLDALHNLLSNEENWSCLFALEILKDIKNGRSVPYLIDFIMNNEEGDYWKGCEEAMHAIRAINKPAIIPLLQKIKENFEKKKYYSFLVGALTEIKDEKVYDFMLEITKDYLQNYKKYDNWFQIDDFTYNFEKQENKEILPILEELANMNHLSNREKIEIKDTILIIKDSKKFNLDSKIDIEDIKKSFGDFEKIIKGDKLNIDKKEFLKRASTPDKEFEANFKCKNCNERQNLKTGMMWDMNDNFSFENEIMCKHCFSHDLELTKISKEELFSKRIRILLGKDKGILPAGDKILIEDKKILYSKAYQYVLKRIKEEPENGELSLRAANTSRKLNFYEKAIKFYEESLELNNKLIASYINLIEIYLYRYNYYGLAEGLSKALFYFPKLLELFNSHNYNIATIKDEDYILNFIENASEELGLKVKFKKVGRNEPCPCGSGKKYKKCCLGKEEDGA